MEAGFAYSTDLLPDPAVWEKMLNISPIKHVAQVYFPPLRTAKVMVFCWGLLLCLSVGKTNKVGF